jgi:hypothetical protein
MRFLLASLNTLTNSKVVPKAASKFCSGFPLLSLINFFECRYIHSRLSEQFSESQAGFGKTIKGTGGYQKAGTSSLKRVSGRNFTISKRFHRSKQKLHFAFPSQKRQLKIVKP